MDEGRVKTKLLEVIESTKPGMNLVGDALSAVELLPEGDTRTALQQMLINCQGNLQSARSQAEEWFNAKMLSISELYKRHARNIAITISLIVVFALGVDSVAIARYLWRSPVVRAGVIQQVDKVIEQDGLADKTVSQYVDELKALNIPLFWDASQFPVEASKAFEYWSLKLVGLLLSWMAASQGSSFWYQLLKQLREMKPAQAQTAGSANGGG